MTQVMEKPDWHKLPTPDFESVIGMGLGPRYMEYTWRDVVLYALGVGCGKDDLTYVWEGCPGGFKALPTFVLVAYLNAIQLQPQRRVPYAPNEIPGDMIIKALNGYIPNRLHMGIDICMYRPIDSMCGKFLTEDCVEEIFDWGEKGVVNQCKMDMYDIGGNPVATVRSQHMIAAFGNNGRPKYVSNKMDYPDRTPDFECEDLIADNLAVLYRLTGDTYTTHIDPEVGKSYGYKGAFMQGLCSIGFAARLAIQKFIPNQPERVTHIASQLRSVTFPNTRVKFQAWKIEEGRIIYKMFGDNGKAIVDNCLLEYK
ncbi:MAG: hypothetical protein LIP16_06965 [Clostridium sp.]|nr:hypothetical protein [Clostridium sp.]